MIRFRLGEGEVGVSAPGDIGEYHEEHQATSQPDRGIERSMLRAKRE
jgi:hypothetical protein